MSPQPILSLATGYDIDYLGSEPSRTHPWLEQLAKQLTRPARILDCGSGLGCHALPLARGGHRVTAIDQSAVAIHSLDQAAGWLNYPIRGFCGDACELVRREKPASYDLVIIGRILQSMSPEAAQSLVSAAQKVTAPGGYHFVAAYLEDGSVPDDGKFVPESEPDLLKLYCPENWAVTRRGGEAEELARQFPIGYDGLLFEPAIVIGAPMAVLCIVRKSY